MRTGFWLLSIALTIFYSDLEARTVLISCRPRIDTTSGRAFYAEVANPASRKTNGLLTHMETKCDSFVQKLFPDWNIESKRDGFYFATFDSINEANEAIRAFRKCEQRLLLESDLTILLTVDERGTL